VELSFQKSTTPRDWTNEKLDAIRAFYSRFTDNGGATAVNLQGIQFETNGGGRLPLERYLRVTLVERESLRKGAKSLSEVAREHSVNEKYLTTLWSALNDTQPSLVLDMIRSQWKAAGPDDAPALVSTIAQWQQTLWRFTTIGHIGKRDGPKAWQEPVQPIAERQEIRVKLSAPQDGKNVTLYLTTSDASDGNEKDFAVWENPRFSAPGQPDLLLRDVRHAVTALSAHREQVLDSAAACLEAAAEAGASVDSESVAALAKKHGVDQTVLASWFSYLGIGAGEARIESYITEKLDRTSNYEFVKGWTGPDALSVLANSSDEFVRIPGDMHPHSVGVHPSPKLRAIVGWRSPIAGKLKVTGRVQRAHIGCGNGVTWLVELRRGTTRQRLAAGVAGGAEEQVFGPLEDLNVQPGDLVSLIVGPRDGEHSCDMTSIGLTVQSLDDPTQEWDLAKDVSPDVLAGNPHADRHGNSNVWHFYSEPDAGGGAESIIPAGSLIAHWQAATDPASRKQLAAKVQSLLKGGTGELAADSPDVALYRQLASLNGPLFSAVRKEYLSQERDSSTKSDSRFGVDPELFGRHPNGGTVAPANLCVQAPAVIEVSVPADMVEGCEFVATATLHAETASEGTVQLQVLTTKPEQVSGVAASAASIKGGKSTWSDGDKPVTQDAPILVTENSAAKARLMAQFDEFRNLFPAALCYTRIVPVDEVVTLTLYYREDDHLVRLMLNDEQTAELNQLWDDMHYVSQDALALVDAYEQLWQFATQDADPSAFTPMREGIMQSAEEFRKLMAETEPRHIEAVMEFAGRAWRRPVTDAEKHQLTALYSRLRQQELSHDAAVRLLLSRVLVTPAFLYRGEHAAPGTKATFVSNEELAGRLSYFLWSSVPDQELRDVVAAGTLQQPEVLRAQTRRMLSDDRMRRMAIEFGCQWLHIREFDQLDEKSDQHYPEFKELRADMYEESIRFFEDLFRNDGSILDLLNADHTFVNGRLAQFYGIAGLNGDEWQRVNGTKAVSRGGILTMAATLAKQSGASRTSPILRGNWVSEFLLGDKLPRPPKGVPVLPEEVPADLTERQLIETHSSDPACAKCHAKIDSFGFALEQFDTIGRLRAEDTSGHEIDVAAVLPDGTPVNGVVGLRDYILNNRREDFLRTFCRRLLGYALGRSIQLSDEPLIDEMMVELKKNDYRFSVAVELIVLSPQFRMIRGADTPRSMAEGD
jgi:transposase-like protein